VKDTTKRGHHMLGSAHFAQMGYIQYTLGFPTVPRILHAGNHASETGASRMIQAIAGTEAVATGSHLFPSCAVNLAVTD
jgi:hypothetical protein